MIVFQNSLKTNFFSIICHIRILRPNEKQKMMLLFRNESKIHVWFYLISRGMTSQDSNFHMFDVIRVTGCIMMSSLASFFHQMRIIWHYAGEIFPKIVLLHTITQRERLLSFCDCQCYFRGVWRHWCHHGVTKLIPLETLR